jgi:hypothetical protein
MKGSPRSILLTWANAAAGWWTSAAVAALQRQQRAMVNAMKGKRARKAPRKRRR